MTLRYRCVPAWTAVLCFLLGTGIFPGVGAAQTRAPLPADEWSNLALEEALIKFQHRTGTDLRYDPRLLAGKRTQVVAPEGTSPEHLLRAMLLGSGLHVYRLSTGSYAIKEIDVSSPRPGSLSGYVFDQETGAPLPNVHVLLADASGQGAATNAIGLFAFPALRPGQHLIRISHLGYSVQFDTVEVWPGKHLELMVELKARPVPIRPIIVEGDPDFDYPRLLGNTLQEERLAQINALGTPDPVRGLNTLQGIRVGDATADVHIQGGESGEHQFRLDGVPVFEPVHLRGLLGAFNPFAIERITAYKAGFSAARGSYLAGVIEAEHALTDADGHPLDVQVDPLSLNGRVNLHAGRPEGAHGQFMAAVRTSVWDVYSPSRIDSLLLDWNTPDPFIMRASLLPLRDEVPGVFNRWIQQLDSIPPPGLPDLGFTDVHVAGRLRFTHGTSLHASYYRGGNRLESRRLITVLDEEATKETPNPDYYEWVNENAQVRGATLPAPNLFVSTRLRSSLYHLRHTYSALDNVNVAVLPYGDGIVTPLDLTPSDDRNRIRETALESTLNLAHWAGHAQMGVELIHSSHRFTIDDAFTRRIDLDDSAWRMALFAEEKLVLLPRMTLTAGTRVTYHGPHATFYAEPRLSVRYDLPESPVGALSVRGATGLYRQFLNQFDISNISPSTLFSSIRFWMPVDSTIAPPKAYHATADLVLQPADGWAFHLESYYKKQPHLLRIDYPALWQRGIDEADGSTPSITAQNEFLESSEGYAYGGAFVVERISAKARTALRYEYNVARREYAFQDTTRFETAPWNEPHLFEFSLDWTPHPRMIATARWRSAWGRSWGFRRSYYDFLGTDVTQEPIYGAFDFRDPDRHTLPAFHQLDLGAAYTRPIGPAALQLRLDLLNATNQDNVAERNLIEEEQDDRIVFASQDRYLLSRSLSVSVRLQW